MSTTNKDGKVIEEELKCNDCELVFNALSQKNQHLEGKKHAAAIVAKKSNLPNKTPVNKTHFCEVCNIALNSDGQVKQHMSGMKHKIAAGIISPTSNWWPVELEATNSKRSSGMGIGESYRCDTCNLDLNSEFQYNSHIDGSKHKEKLAQKEARRQAQARGRGGGMMRGGRMRGMMGFRGRGLPPSVGMRPPFHGLPPFHGPVPFLGRRPALDEPWLCQRFEPRMRHSLRPMLRGHPLGFRPYPIRGKGRI